jgi:hypothetical protein
MLSIAVAVLAVGQFAIFAHFGRVQALSSPGRESQGPAVGIRAPKIDSTGLDGHEVHVGADTGPAVIMFAKTDCTACTAIRDKLGDVVNAFPTLPVLVICSGRREAIVRWAAAVPPGVIVVPDEHGQISGEFRVEVWPMFVALSAGGVVASKGVLNSREAVFGLCDAAVGQLSARLSGQSNLAVELRP